MKRGGGRVGGGEVRGGIGEGYREGKGSEEGGGRRRRKMLNDGWSEGIKLNNHATVEGGAGESKVYIHSLL